MYFSSIFGTQSIFPLASFPFPKLFYKQMCIISKEIVKYHRHKLWFSKQTITFVVNSTSKLSRVLITVFYFYITFNTTRTKIFFTNPTLCCFLKIKFVFRSQNQYFHFRRPNLLIVVLNLFTNISPMFLSSVCFVYKTGSSFFPLQAIQ